MQIGLHSFTQAGYNEVSWNWWLKADTRLTETRVPSLRWRWGIPQFCRLLPTTNQLASRRKPHSKQWHCSAIFLSPLYHVEMMSSLLEHCMDDFRVFRLNFVVCPKTRTSLHDILSLMMSLNIIISSWMVHVLKSSCSPSHFQRALPRKHNNVTWQV